MLDYELGILEAPLLVLATPVGVDLDIGAVAGATSVKDSAALPADNAVVAAANALYSPLLVLATPVGVKLDIGAIAAATSVKGSAALPAFDPVVAAANIH